MCLEAANYMSVFNGVHFLDVANLKAQFESTAAFVSSQFQPDFILRYASFVPESMPVMSIQYLTDSTPHISDINAGGRPKYFRQHSSIKARSALSPQR
eukprot:m.191854 g.191854  ORF g.191854 m.191854 type:complete len:98 (+) comp39454_c1_seq4:213-506(+)